MDRRHIRYSVLVRVHMIVAADCIRNYSAGSGSVSHHAHAGDNVSVKPVRGG